MMLPHAICIASLLALAACRTPAPPVSVELPATPEDPALTLLRQQAVTGDKLWQLALGRRLDEDKKYAEALDWYRKAAEQGLADAQYLYACMLAEGAAAPPQPTHAAKWFRDAADQNHPEAQFNLAMLYAEGKGLPESASEAAKWLRKSAEGGYATAQFLLAARLLRGSVPTGATAAEIIESIKWLGAAAQQGHRDAQFYLGDAYWRGRGVKADKVQAYKWLNLSGAAGSEEARRSRTALTRQMTPQEIAQGQLLSTEFKPSQP